MAGPANLDAIPTNISQDFFKNVTLTGRARERGYNFFINGYVHGIKIYTSSQKIIELQAKCFRSMKKNDPPHVLNMTMDCEEQDIIDSHCSCKAGISGTCSHAVAVVFTLKHYKNMGFKSVPSELACTSLPQQWHKPRGSRIKPEPVASMVFAKAKETPRKRKPVLTATPEQRIPQLEKEHIKKLREDTNIPLSYLLDENILRQTTAHGDVHLGSMLPYHFQHFKSHVHVDTGSCGDTQFPRSKTNINIDSIYLSMSDVCGVNVNMDKALNIENQTLMQSDCPLWFQERQKRLTASQFARICKRKKDVNETFLNSIFQTSNSSFFSSNATSYGKAQEKDAKKSYLDKFPDSHVHDCGLVINPKFPYLAATPDGKVCINGETSVMEVKCPYSARDMEIYEAVDEISTFCLEKTTNDTLRLKDTHDYYYQVQGQMMVTGAKFCVFVVYTKRLNYFVEIIKENINFQQDIFDKMSRVYMNHAVSHISPPA